MDARYDIRLALTDRDRAAIVRLRRQGAAPFPETPSTNGHAHPLEPPDPLDAGAHIFGAFEGHHAVGAMRLHVLREVASPYSQDLRLPEFGQYFPYQMGLVSGFIVARHIERDANIVAQLVRQMLCVSYLHRLEFVCGAFGASWLPLMETLGWRRYLPVAECPELHGAVAMCFALSDADHLRQVGSPYATLASTFGSNRFAAAYFRQMLDQRERERSAGMRTRAMAEND